MKSLSVQTLLLAAACVLSLAAAMNSDYGGTEFSGGTLTGPLVHLNNSGIVLFIVALVLTFVYRRIAAICALAASLLCLPLYLYLSAPGVVQWMLPGEYSVRAQGGFVWDQWALIGILMLPVFAYICIRSFSEPRTKAASAIQ